MRWLFLFVLFLNLAYVGWQVSRSPADSYADIESLQNVERIVLLSEIKSQTVNVKTVKQNVEAVKPVQLAVSVAEEKQQKRLDAASKQKLSNPVDINNGKNISKKVVEVKEVPTTNQDLMLAEKTTDRCFAMGPFRALDRLSGLTQEIKPYVTTTRFRSREEKKPTVYWVYIKPEKNRNKAIEVGKRLKAKKIKDFYVIREGEKVNGLSLGHFRNKKGAYGLTKKIKNLGFNVQVEPVYKKITLYWLDYQLQANKKIPGSVVEKYMKSAQKEKMTHLARDCAG